MSMVCKSDSEVTALGLILRPRMGLCYPHLFGYELVLLARHHFHLCDSLDKHLSGQGCQRTNFTAVNTNIVCVLFVVSLDARISKWNLPKLVGLSKWSRHLRLHYPSTKCPAINGEKWPVFYSARLHSGSFGITFHLHKRAWCVWTVWRCVCLRF